MNDIYESRDKQIVPFMLIQSNIKYLGTRREDQVIYFQFSPLEKCLELVNEFTSRKALPVQPKDILDAVETFRDRVFEMKNKEYGNNSK